MKKFSLILHFWGIYGIFFHQTAIKSFSPQKEERLRFSSIVWENSLFTNIYMIKIGLLSPMLEIQMKSYVSANNESIVLYRHLIYLRWNILLSVTLLVNKFINLGIYRGYETSYFEPLIVLTQLNYLSPMVILKVGRGFKVLHPLRGVLHIIVVKCKCKVKCSNRLTFLLEKNTYRKSYF